MPLIEHSTVAKVTRESWREFFDAHAPNYMSNSFTAGTLGEVQFVIDELNLSSGDRILDVGCGTGRHAIELAKRGYRVVGVDISANMLASARIAAAKAGVAVDLVNADATQLSLTESFDAAVSLCEGAFSLLAFDDAPDEHDMNIVCNIASSLKAEGRLILTVPNALRKIRELAQQDVDTDRFDLATLVETLEEVETPVGTERVHLKQKYYTPHELVGMLSQAGFRVDQIWGGTAGRWARRKIDLDEMEFMVTATKSK
jgi:2-polyprenyl-3-methyl-5-hydroxy-6-metoxy-1,4-benzoquinol methylase